MLKLIKAQEQYIDKVIKNLDEFENDTSIISAVQRLINTKKNNNFSEYFAYIKKFEQGTNLDPHNVKQSIFWLFEEDECIGVFALRHSLTDELRQIGGNIAYQILPSKQGKKYAQKGLALCLAEAKKLGLEKVLITCDESNIPSYKVAYNAMIEMGGVEGVKNEVAGNKVCRFWINTKKRYNHTIRPLAIAVIKKGNKVLVMKGFDSKKNEEFYRLPGGGIDFAETAEDCLKREFLEELGIDINIIKQLPTYQNIFEFEGHHGHEIIIPFEASLSLEDMQKESFQMIEEEFAGRTMDFVEINQNNRIYPPIL